MKMDKLTEDANKRSILVFVHGYNTSFYWASFITAQVTYDTKFPGVAAMFSWPSNEQMVSYPGDMDASDASAAAFSEFLAVLAERKAIEKIYVVAHSMGARLALTAIGPLVGQNVSVRSKLKEVILAAPDLGVEKFERELAPAVVKHGIRITTYASDDDRALRISESGNNERRVGQAGKDILLVSGVDTIDATGHVGGFPGHALLNSKAITQDVQELIVYGSPADQRQQTRSIRKGTIGHGYWVLGQGN